MLPMSSLLNDIDCSISRRNDVFSTRRRIWGEAVLNILTIAGNVICDLWDYARSHSEAGLWGRSRQTVLLRSCPTERTSRWVAKRRVQARD